MGETTGISWTHHSFNPWIGCSEISEGCAFCYAKKLATGKMGLKVWGRRKPRHVTKTWDQPPRWNRQAIAAGERRRVFCASMADVFEDREDLLEPRARLWKLIQSTPALDWLLLTKRAENLQRMVPWGAHGDPWPNVWLGVSAENQARWQQRVPLLSSTPAAVRFVSYEPAIGPLHIFDVSHRAIDWIICGGESGPKRRPFDKDWARRVRDDCDKVGIAFFYKQEGGARPEGNTPPLLDGRVHHEFPLTGGDQRASSPSISQED
jgi:protein gp37